MYAAGLTMTCPFLDQRFQKSIKKQQVTGARAPVGGMVSKETRHSRMTMEHPLLHIVDTKRIHSQRYSIDTLQISQCWPHNKPIPGQLWQPHDVSNHFKSTFLVTFAFQSIELG